MMRISVPIPMYMLLHSGCVMEIYPQTEGGNS